VVSDDDDIMDNTIPVISKKRRRIESQSSPIKRVRIKEDHVKIQPQQIIKKGVIDDDHDDDIDNGCIFKVLALEHYGCRKFHDWIKEDMIYEIEQFPNRYHEHGFNFDVSRMLTRLNTPCNEGKCQFSIPEFAQVAADTFHIPIVVCDNATSNRVYLPISALFSWRPAVILYFENFNLVNWKTHKDISSISTIANLNSRHISVCERLGWPLGIRNADKCYPKIKGN